MFASKTPAPVYAVVTALLLCLDVAEGHAQRSKCDAARLVAAGKLSSATLGCHAKAARAGAAAANECLDKALAKFVQQYDKANKPGDCTVAGLDEESVGGAVSSDVATYLAAQRPQQDANPCAALKLAGVGKGVLAQLKCEAKAIRTGAALDSACTTKADDKLQSTFAKAESNHPPCFSSGDASAVWEDVVTKVGDLSREVYQPPTPTNTPTATRTATLIQTGTATSTRSASPTVTRTINPTPQTPTSTGTATTTPTPACGGTAPLCNGACPPFSYCQGDFTGCHCVGDIAP